MDLCCQLVMPPKRKTAPSPKAKPAASRKRASSSGGRQPVENAIAAFIMEPLSTIRRPIETVKGEDGGAPQLADLLAHYQLRGPNSTGGLVGALKIGFENDEVQRRVRLPNMLKGWELKSPQELLEMDPQMREYVQEPILREIEVDPEFEEKFRTAGFIESLNVLLVPILTPEEEAAFLNDKDGFLTTMSTYAWLGDQNRMFWVCDGATRRHLSLKYKTRLWATFLRPDIPYSSAVTIASYQNEGKSRYIVTTHM